MTQECVKKYDQHKAVDSPCMYSAAFISWWPLLVSYYWRLLNK